MPKKSTGLEPRGFRWVITSRLAVAERIGGYGFQHRKVRREEELIWLQDQGVNSIVSFLGTNQNSVAYEAAGFEFYSCEVDTELEPEDALPVFEVLSEALEDPEAVVLVHRDTIDDTLGGLLAGYLIHSEMLDDPIVATDVVQRILGRAIGPEGRRLIPEI
ncbi:MAG: hypothetical protein ACR2N2_04090 [Acidimicrobiia bacterium]